MNMDRKENGMNMDCKENGMNNGYDEYELLAHLHLIPNWFECFQPFEKQNKINKPLNLQHCV